MKRNVLLSYLGLLMLLLSGCGGIGEKTASVSVIYGVAAVLSLILLILYCCIVQKKEVWFLLLFASVLVVNIGYFTLSISGNLEEALLANRIAYLGSVFLPMSMLMIILKVTRMKYPRWLPGLLLGIGIAVFLVAASPGYLDIYYQEVSFARVNGVSVLNKVYGPWHCLYLVYLMGYFLATVAAAIHGAVRKKMDSAAQAVILVVAVFVNLGVWLIEQLVKIDFEILSLSYIISEMFLLGLDRIMQENEKLQKILSSQEQTVKLPEEKAKIPPVQPELPCVDCSRFQEGLATLTKTERAIYNRYVAGKSTKEILDELNIKENTLKFHNKNLYGKLGVSSRKQLLEIYRQTRKDGK